MILRCFNLFLLIQLISLNSSGQIDSVSVKKIRNGIEIPWSAGRHSRTALICAGFNYGAIWSHNESVSHLTKSHPIQVFAEFNFQNLEKLWCKNFRAAAAGINLTYIDYRSTVLGKSVAAITYLEPWIQKKISFRIGTGAVYNTNPFDLTTNSTNIMLGSRFAMVMHCQVTRTFCFSVGNNWEAPHIRLGIGLTHFSNGAFTQPNSGINNFFVSAGYCFGYQGHKYALKHPPQLPKDTVSFTLSSSFSLVEKYPVSGPKYTVYQVQGRIRYKIGKLSRLSIGADWMKNLSVEAEIKEKPKTGTSAEVIGIPIGHELQISENLSLITEWGFYVYKKNQIHPSMYQRYGLRYLVWKGAFAGIHFKTHRAKAECLELNLGYQF